MVKITLRLDKRYKLSDGRYAVKLALARNGKTMYIPLNLSVKETEWDAEAVNHIKNLPQKKALNTYINNQLSQAEIKIMDLQAKGQLRLYSDQRLIEYLSTDRKSKDSMQLFKTYAEQFVSEKKNPNTREAYEVAIKAVSQYCNIDALQLKDITRLWLESFNDYLKDKGHKQQTIISYINKVRAIYIYAADKGGIDVSFPHVRFPRVTIRKRSLTIEQLRKIINAPCTKKQKQYIDTFLLILMMRGINMRDLSLLKADAIKDGYIEYDRSKTGKHYRIKIEPEIREIIERYQGREYLLRFFDNKKDENYYKRFGHTLALGLRIVFKSVGTEEAVSAYYARHTWATLAIELGASMEMVSAGLGHSIGEQVTQIYVAFQQKQIDDLARKIIDYLLEKGKYKK